MDRCVLLCTTGANEAFFERGVLVTLRSLRITNPDLPVVVFYDHLNQRQREQLIGCELRSVDPAVFSVDHRRDLTTATFFRFYLGQELGDVRRVLYLDTDLVVLDDLSALFEVDHPLVATRKIPPDARYEINNIVDVATAEGVHPMGPVFNAGVLCFDGSYWRSRDLLGRALAIARRYGWEAFPNCDQGILNLIAASLDGWWELPHIYNFRPAGAPRAPLRRNRNGLLAPMVRGEFAKVVHWAGPKKPWLSRRTVLHRTFPRLHRVTADACYHDLVEARCGRH
jgi:lipopolysaccharide biosynthesis glycosyltransferase